MSITEYPEEFGPLSYSLRIDGDHLDLGGKRDRGELVFVMFNPANAKENPRRLSPTRRRCIHFAESWGFGALTTVNLFAYRSSSKQEVFQASFYTEVVGPENDRVILDAAGKADMVVAAWGELENTQLFVNRSNQVVKLLQPLHKQLYCLEKNSDEYGSPAHPSPQGIRGPIKLDIDPKPWP